MAISLQIDGKEAALKKGSSIEYVSENRAFTDADDYSLEIELPVGYFSHARQCPSKLALHSLNRKSADCPQNIAIFGLLTRKDIDTEEIFFDAVLQDTNFYKRGAVVITGITHEAVKVQFLEKRSYQNFYTEFDETYIDELDLGEWPHIFPDNISSGGMSENPRPRWEDAVYMPPAQMWAKWQDFTALPWVNNYSGNLQNCARWNASANKYEWKVVGDDDEDTDFTKGFSFQPNLLWLTKKICNALGYAEGGFTPKGRVDEVAGVVHAGEWVASQKLLASPVARPLIEALDYAQRTNTIGSLRQTDVSRTITAPAVLAQSQPPTIIVQENNALRETLAQLNQRLNEPFVTINTVTGDMGIKQAQDDYQRLMNNKSPKSKRK